MEQITDVAEREGATRVTDVRLRVGRLSGVTPDALTFAWEIARADTVAAWAALRIEEIPVSVYCASCDQQGEPPPGEGLVCATCGEPAPVILGGRELELVAMEVL